jgi:endonuclease/exonuclease/phosphatase family metal-dependent hydrolase
MANVRVASYNVENLFARPNAFDLSDPDAGEPILAAYHEFNKLIAVSDYSPTDRKRMRDLLEDLDVYTRNNQGALRRKRTTNPKWAWLRKNRGSFDREPRDPTKDVEIIAEKRADWIGWLELATEAVDEVGTRTTARVIADIDADIIAIIEAENRPSLIRLNRELLDNQYEHVMLVDGNDERGIDVGIMTKKGFEIESIRSNVDLKDRTGPVFSRDCAQYTIRTPSGEVVHVLVNHFKSQSGGGATKRKRQAKEVRRIADELVAADQHVIVLGDLNEGQPSLTRAPTSLRTLFDPNGPLVSCYDLPDFEVGNKPGTFDSCALDERLDYLLVSHSLRPKYKSGELFRKGLWGSRKTPPTAWTIYDEMKNSHDQASDHAAVVVDFDL